MMALAASTTVEFATKKNNNHKDEDVLIINEDYDYDEEEEYDDNSFVQLQGDEETQSHLNVRDSPSASGK